LSHWQQQTALEISPAALFPAPPVIRFAPSAKLCPCGGRLLIQKSRRKTVLSINGPFIAHETVTACSGCGRGFGSEALLSLVAKRSNVSYDLLIFVGRALFQRYRSVYEVRFELAARNIRLSASEVDYLGRKFITILAIAHRRAAPRIRQAMSMAGGYILHLDATHDGDAPALMTGRDSLSKFVLANIKLPSEHADHIIPFLRRLEADYGVPLACVRDMGVGIGRAVAVVFPGIREFICHFHFLRDIGRDYLEPAYARLRKCLRSHATSSRLHALARDLRQALGEHNDCGAIFASAIINSATLEGTKLLPLIATYSLTLWTLHGKRHGDGYGFPFDRPLLGFVERLLQLEGLMPQLLELLGNDDEPQVSQPVFKLVSQACFVAEDQEVRQAVDELRWRCLVFERLRTAMRIAPAGGDCGLNDEGTSETMSSIRQGVEKFRSYLNEDPKLAADPLSKKMAGQIDKYGDKLFADPITVDTPRGPATIYPQRTNNILEQFFRGIRRGYRRKTGNNSMCRALQAMLADTPLVKNLDNPDYMKILLNGKANLEELFAELGSTHLDVPAEEQLDNTDRILPGFRALINLPALPGQVIRSLTGSVNMVKSN
jgi:hypothetical protein